MEKLSTTPNFEIRKLTAWCVKPSRWKITSNFSPETNKKDVFQTYGCQIRNIRSIRSKHRFIENNSYFMQLFIFWLYL